MWARGALIVLILAASAADTWAQEIEPRAFSNIPIGVNFVIAGYAYAEGGLVTDPALPLENANLQTHNTVLAYARALDLWGRSGKFDVILPYSWISGTAELAGQPQEREISGLGDPRLRFSVNLFGAPALSLKEFASYQQNTIIGASVQVSIPTGQYDDNKLVNVGTNRWFVKPELGISKTWGPWTLELATAVTFFEDNDDFLSGMKREQDPIYSVQGGLIYGFRNGIWVALNGTYFTGGRTTVDGVENDDRQKNSRAGITVALPINRHNSVKLYASTGVSTRTGSDFDIIGIAWQYRWGGGL
ncbi:MAG: transporter [Candidatus Competibacteraceae bacterium]|nr:transporter [Candidatus Competibacteraceae bacterium]